MENVSLLQLCCKCNPAFFLFAVDDLEFIREARQNIVFPCIDDTAHDIDGIGFHEARGIFCEQNHDVCDDIRDNDIECAGNLIRQIAADTCL